MKICPITQDEIKVEITLDNVDFELDAILNHLRINQGQSRHPYTQRPFTDAQLKSIYVAALQSNPSFLMEQGWFLPSSFFASLSDTQHPTDTPDATQHPSGATQHPSGATPNSSGATQHPTGTTDTPRTQVLTGHETHVLAVVLFMFLLLFIVLMRWIA
jgi:hypothetical protein